MIECSTPKMFPQPEVLHYRFLSIGFLSFLRVVKLVPTILQKKVYQLQANYSIILTKKTPLRGFVIFRSNNLSKIDEEVTHDVHLLLLLF